MSKDVSLCHQDKQFPQGRMYSSRSVNCDRLVQRGKYVERNFLAARRDSQLRTVPQFIEEGIIACHHRSRQKFVLKRGIARPSASGHKPTRESPTTPTALDYRPS